MRYYMAMARPDGPPEDPDIVLVKDGFCWPALLVPVLWLAWHRLWLALLGYLAAGALLAGAATLLGLSDLGRLAVSLAFAVLVAAHANDLRRHRLRRRGYRPVAVVAGTDLAAAEHRLFSRWPAATPAETAP